MLGIWVLKDLMPSLAPELLTKWLHLKLLLRCGLP